jgi:multicomponent Na+:H+ antiporter subunit F
MMSQMLNTVAWICLIVNTISIVMLLYRAIKGPSNPDRAVAIDTIGINLISMIGIIAIKFNTTQLNDIILLIGIISFIATVAIAKFLEKGVIIDRSRD